MNETQKVTMTEQMTQLLDRVGDIRWYAEETHLAKIRSGVDHYSDKQYKAAYEMLQLQREAVRLAQNMLYLANRIATHGLGTGINSLGELQGSAFNVDRICARIGLLVEASGHDSLDFYFENAARHEARTLSGEEFAAKINERMQDAIQLDAEIVVLDRHIQEREAQGGRGKAKDLADLRHSRQSKKSQAELLRSQNEMAIYARNEFKALRDPVSVNRPHKEAM